MKRIAFLVVMFTTTIAVAQHPPIPSQVFLWDNGMASKNNNGITARMLFDGSAAILAKHGILGIEMERGRQIVYKDQTTESFFIIKKGPVSVTLNGKKAVLDRGSVVCVMPGDMVRIDNTGGSTAQIYEMIYSSIEPMDAARGKAAGGSFILNWNDVVFKPTEKGGTSQFFDRKTAMLNRFDIHVTQLNEGLKSHDPHTHTNEEIILMLDGNAEMQIGTDHQKANPGDVVFLNSMVLHNLTNVGKTPCLYFAIQWN